MNEPAAGDTANEDAIARKRFAILSAVRLSGAIMLAIGLAIIANGFMDLPIEAGYAVFAVGVFDFIAMPVILSRKWKSPAGK
jgi:hypothetical protein